eukprot:79848-Pleurochrysis_carterae.AAC.1
MNSLSSRTLRVVLPIFDNITFAPQQLSKQDSCASAHMQQECERASAPHMMVVYSAVLSYALNLAFIGVRQI